MASPLRRRAKTTMTSKIRRNKKIKEIILETHEEISRLQKSIPLLKEEQLSTLIKQYLTHWEMISSGKVRLFSSINIPSGVLSFI